MEKNIFKITLNNLQAKTRIGWTHEERSIKQLIKMNIFLFMKDSPQGAFTDELHDTICYHQLSDLVVKFCEKQECKLLEHLTEKLSQLIIDHINDSNIVVYKIQLQVCKMNSPIAALKEDVCCEKISYL